MGAGMIGPTALAAQMSAQQSSEDRVLRQVQSTSGSQDDGRIEKSAKDFEAMLLGSWLQQAEQSFATVPGADSNDDDQTGKDQMMSLGVQSLAQGMAQSGGIGIAKMIASALHRAADKTEAPASLAPEKGEIPGKK